MAGDDYDDACLPTQEQLDEHLRELDEYLQKKTDPNDKPSSDRPKVTKFRFKSSRSNRHRDRDDDRHDRSEEQEEESRGRKRSSHHRRHHHHHRHRHSRSKSPPPAPNPWAPNPLDRETAFRESLFDAMADDEGAAYWEGIYGQPIHIYPPPGTSSSARGGAGGHLEQMTDDQYADYVLRKMWEKTHAGLLEARAREKMAKEKQKEEDELRRKERARIEKEMERSLAKGEERRRRRKWEGYLRKWEEWDGLSEDRIPWPEGVGVPGEVKRFFEVGLEGVEDKVGRLKEERVRWHPDKMLQRFGGKVGKGVMKDVTAVFQVVDGLFGELRRGKR
ncbi:hypothetical protein QBC38DRAFT_477103 [Podospora fimiseda]|uniref:Uncharacterized protein n=1 Tax=Podospora fimiseda TaxID=252190 RepID=A0AAN7BQH3_9PEZI|nr:hypothetical protein QBC38DRAFT_477103 [Podospora fimiseda]